MSNSFEEHNIQEIIEVISAVAPTGFAEKMNIYCDVANQCLRLKKLIDFAGFKNPNVRLLVEYTKKDGKYVIYPINLSGTKGE